MRLRGGRSSGQAPGAQAGAGVPYARRVDVLTVAHRPEPNKHAKRCRELVAPYLKRTGARV